MMLGNFSCAVILSTYNNPLALHSCLKSLCEQSKIPDELIVADDGSDAKTREVVNLFKDILMLKHVWHEDEGFRKAKILVTIQSIFFQCFKKSS